MERQQDITLGAIFVALGCAAAWWATSYTGAGGIYPMVLGFLMALMGGVVALRAIRLNTPAKRLLVERPVKLCAAIGIGAIYIAFIVPLGFYTASFLLMLTLPVALGFRRFQYTAAVAGVFIGIVYVVFSVLLDKPLPREWVLTAMGSG